jgi:triosephosphate isomerase
MLKSVGVSSVIIGHSERREYFLESDAFIAEKVDAILAEGLTPIFCCGETLAQREAGIHFDFVCGQLTNSLFHLSAEALQKVVIAYEPIWAIGTGVTASSAQAQEMHKVLRDHLASKYGQTVADEISILYGGSVGAGNAVELFSQPDVDGGLVGGASLKSRDFTDISKSFPASGYLVFMQWYLRKIVVHVIAYGTLGYRYAMTCVNTCVFVGPDARGKNQ